jgi:hypothetical protein
VRECEKTMINSICDSCGKDYTDESWLNTSVLKTGLVNYKFCTECTKKLKSSAQAGRHKQKATTKDGNNIRRTRRTRQIKQ